MLISFQLLNGLIWRWCLSNARLLCQGSSTPQHNTPCSPWQMQAADLLLPSPTVTD